MVLRPSTFWLFLLLSACRGGDRITATIVPKDTPDAGFLDAGPTDSGEPVVDCDSLPALPRPFQTIRGPISSEDFAFDGEGNMVSADDGGNLVKSSIDGEKRLFVPNAGEEIAGMRFLPGGDLVYARVDTGTLMRVAPNGARQPILSGLDYPNGVEVGLDGFVYVSEQSAGRVRRVDPDSGAFTIVAENILNPNGVTFSPDYQTLYIGSFGLGTVYALPIVDGTPGTLRELARTPNAPDPSKVPTVPYPDDQEMQAACSGARSDESCQLRYYEQAGWEATCIDAYQDGALHCFPVWPDTYTPCYGRREGDECTVSWEGASYEGLCESFDYEGETYFDCAVEIPGYTDFSEHGGLDGMGVDLCGNIYVTEFVVGTVWRISPDGSSVEQLFNPDTQWVPNMQWGTGRGGWDEETLYVIDREPELVYAIPLGVRGKRLAFPQ